MLNDKKCLIIVDVQNGFINEHTSHIPKLVEKLQSNYDLVFITKFINELNSPFRRLIHWHKLSPESSDIDLAFEPRKNAEIIVKNIYTCVTSNFLKRLSNAQINIAHICGIDTDICVTKIAVDLFENDITPFILKDYCATTGGNESHKHSLKALGRFIGENQII